MNLKFSDIFFVHNTQIMNQIVLQLRTEHGSDIFAHYAAFQLFENYHRNYGQMCLAGFFVQRFLMDIWYHISPYRESRKVVKPWDFHLELYDCSETWQARRQERCRYARQITKQYNNPNSQSRGLDASGDLMIRCTVGYWNGALVSSWLHPLLMT